MVSCKLGQLQVYNDRSSESDMFCNYVIQRMNQRCKLDGSSDHSGILTYPTWSPAETNNSSLDLTPVAKQTGGSSQFPTAYAPISTAGSMIFDDVSSKTGAPLKLLSKSGGGAAGMTSSSSTHTNNNNSNLLCAPHHSLQQQMSMTTCPHFANNNNHGAGSQQTGFNTQRQQQANMAFNITGGYDNAKANNNSPVNSSGSTTTHQPDSSLTSPLLQLSSPVSPLSPSSTSTTSSTDSSSSAFPNDNGCVNHNIDQQQRSEAIANLQQQQQQLQSLAGDGTSVTSEDDDSGSGTTGNSRYKTEPCRPFEETGVCKYGEKCQFAHGPDELRPLPRHPKYKTEMCKTFHTVGICPYGYRCHFIHNEPLPGPHEQQQQQMMSSTTGGPSRFGTFGNAPGPGDVFVDPGYYGNSNPMSGPFGTWNEQQMQLRTPQQQASLQHQHVLRSASESRYPTSVNRHMAACNEHDGSTTLDWPIDAASAYKAGCYGMPHSADLANVMAVCNKGGGRGVDIRNNNNDTVYYNNHNMATHFHHNIHQHHQNCGGGAAVDLKMSMSSCGRSSSFGSHGSSSGGGGAPLGATGSSLGSHGDSPVPPPSSSDSPASFSPSTTGSEDGGDSGVFGVAAPVNFSLLLHQNQQLQQSCPHQLQRYPGSCECAAHLQAMACSCAGSGMMGPMGPQVFQFPSVNPYGGGAPCYNNGGLLPRSTTNQRGQSLDVCENERHWPERHRHPAQLQLQPTSPAVSAMSGSSVNCYNRVTGSLAKLGSANLVSLDVVATSLKHHMNTTKSSAAAASNCAAVEAAVVVDSLACDLGRGLSNMQILDSTATSGHDANIDASVRSLPPGSRFGGPTFSPPAAHVGWSQGPNDEAGRSMLQTGVAQQRHVESDPVVASGLLTPTNPNQLSRTVSSAESCAAATGNAFSKESSPAIDPRFHQNGPNIPAATPSPLGYQNYCFNNHYQHEQQQQQQKNTSLSTSVSLDNHHFNHDINTTGATLCPPSSPEMSSPSAPLPAGPVAAAKRRLPIFSRLSSSSQQPASTRVGI